MVEGGGEQTMDEGLGAGDSSDEGQLLDVRVVHTRLLGDHVDDSISIQDTSPDYVFMPPPRTTPQRDQESSELIDSISPRSGGCRISASRLNVAFFIAFPGAVVAATVFILWRWKRLLQSRQNFIRALSAIERAAAQLKDPSADPYLRQGSLQERLRIAIKRLSEAEGSISSAFKLFRRSPWDPTGALRRRLAACSCTLEQLRTRFERASEELEVMREIEVMLHTLDADKPGESKIPDSVAEDNRDAKQNRPSTNGSSGQEVVEHQHHRLRPPQRSTGLPRVRLATRAKFLANAENRSGVFERELDRFCEELSNREERAGDWLQYGLREWDLARVDKALEELRILELPELADKFSERREHVRGKLWGLKQDLQKALYSHAGGDDARSARLRRACVKAETFSATGLSEYELARRALDKLQHAELERHARRVLTSHGLRSHPSCNVRLDDERWPALLINEAVNNTALMSANRIPPLDLSPDIVARRITLESSDNTKTILEQHQDGVMTANRRQSRSSIDSSESVRSSSRNMEGSWGEWPHVADADFGLWGRDPSARAAGLLAIRASAERQFFEYAQRQRDFYVTSREADRKEMEKREEKEVYRKECVAILDARLEQEEKRLRLEQERRSQEEIDRRRARDERERRKNAERLADLWYADGVFFWGLAMADVVISVGMAAWSLGFSLYPPTILETAWHLITSECHEVRADGHVSIAAKAAASATLPARQEAAVTVPVDQAGHGLTYGEFGAVAPPAYVDRSSAVASPLNGASDPATGTLWRVWSSTVSAAGAALRTGYGSVAWMLGQTLTFVTPDLRCEMRAGLAAITWLVSLVLALRLATSIGADGRGPTGAFIRLAILSTWIWGRFHQWLVAISRCIFFYIAPIPTLVLAYGPLLHYVERHMKPEGLWWWKGWDIRFVVSRVIPLVTSILLSACFGAQSACEARRGQWWCFLNASRRDSMSDAFDVSYSDARTDL